MSATALGLFSAAAAILGKIAFDLWVRYCQRQAAAAALSGEISGCLKVLKPTIFVWSIRQIVGMDEAERKNFLSAMSPVPSGHPVFDKIADRLGILPPDLVQDITIFYNVISGMRLLLNHTSTDKFLNAESKRQVDFLANLANGLEEHLTPAYSTVAKLDDLWRQSIWQYLLASWVMLRGLPPPQTLPTPPAPPAAPRGTPGA